MINLSSTTPGAANGGTNVTWQTDASGNVSGYVAKIKQTVAPVAGVLTIDASTGDSFLITVNASITSMSIINPTDGKEITLLWAQDTTGHAVTLAANLLGATAPSTTANSHSGQRFSFNIADANWYSCGVGSAGM